MKFRPPIYVLPLLVIGALLLDRLEGAVGTSSETDPSARNDLASVLGSSPPPAASFGTDMSVLDCQLPNSHAILVRAVPASESAPAITIEFELGRPGYARMDIYDARGREVRRLIGEVFNAGLQRRIWDGCNNEGARLPSGAYFARLESLGKVSSLRLVLD